jgi:hypothetical protein
MEHGFADVIKGGDHGLRVSWIGENEGIFFITRWDDNARQLPTSTTDSALQGVPLYPRPARYVFPRTD